MLAQMAARFCHLLSVWSHTAMFESRITWATYVSDLPGRTTTHQVIRLHCQNLFCVAKLALCISLRAHACVCEASALNERTCPAVRVHVAAATLQTNAAPAVPTSLFLSHLLLHLLAARALARAPSFFLVRTTGLAPSSAPSTRAPRATQAWPRSRRSSACRRTSCPTRCACMYTRVCVALQSLTDVCVRPASTLSTMRSSTS